MNGTVAFRSRGYCNIIYIRCFSVTSRSPCENVEKGLSSRREKAREKRWIRTEEFRKYFQKLEQNVDFNVLSPVEREIHKMHKIANDTEKFTYKDPESGFKVLSGLYHYLRGKCCGKACRHCPYEHIGVPEKAKEEKRFNSAFYVSIDTNTTLFIDPTLIPRRPKPQKR